MTTFEEVVRFEEIKRDYAFRKITSKELKQLRYQGVLSLQQLAEIRLTAPRLRGKPRLRLNERQKKRRRKASQALHSEQRRQEIREIKIALNSMFGSRAHRWGLTVLDLQTMLQKQDYKCAVCLEPFHPQQRRPEIDHCHKAGEIRGLLCRDCNLGLGCFKDNVQSLDNAARYLTGDCSQADPNPATDAGLPADGHRVLS